MIFIIPPAPRRPDTMIHRSRLPDVLLPPPPPAGVEQPSSNTPATFALGRSYPNAFTPTTSITDALPEEAYVRLFVYSMLGQEVATLVDEEQTAGYKSVSFDGVALPSGMYTYRLTADSFSDVRKTVLLK